MNARWKRGRERGRGRGRGRGGNGNGTGDGDSWTNTKGNRNGRGDGNEGGIEEGVGEVKKHKKPQRSCRRDVGKGGDLGGKRNT